MTDSLPGDPPGGPRDDLPDEEAALLHLLRQDERRVLSSAALTADPNRIAEGWERRFLADGPRAAEAVALYEALGYEVEAVALAGSHLPADCTDCQLATLLAFKTIYTRKPKENAR